MDTILIWTGFAVAFFTVNRTLAAAPMAGLGVTARRSMEASAIALMLVTGLYNVLLAEIN